MCIYNPQHANIDFKTDLDVLITFRRFPAYHSQIRKDVLSFIPKIHDGIRMAGYTPYIQHAYMFTPFTLIETGTGSFGQKTGRSQNGHQK